jgi:hypothetical protein
VSQQANKPNSNRLSLKIETKIQTNVSLLASNLCNTDFIECHHFVGMAMPCVPDNKPVVSTTTTTTTTCFCLSLCTAFMASIAAADSRQKLRNAQISRSGGLLPSTRRILAHPAALLVPTAAQTATKFATQRRFSCFPPCEVPQFGGNWRIFVANCNRPHSGFVLMIFLSLLTANC